MPDTPSAPRYGALIRDKSLPRANAIVVAVPALAFIYVALSAGPFSAMSAGVLLLALGLLALCAWTFTYRARIYEQGVTVESLFGRRALSFRDLHTFGYARVVQAGQPRDSLTLVPRTGKPLRIVTQPSARSGGDSDLSALVAALSPRIVARLEKELMRSQRVSWVARVAGTMPPQPAVALTRTGIVVEESGVTAPFSDLETSVSNGLFSASSRTTGKRLFAIPCLAVNFYPGLALLQKLSQPAPAEPVAAPAGP